MTIKQQFLTATRWNALASGIIALLQWVQMLVLVRLLPPSDFGPMALLGVVFLVGYALTDLGLSSNIQRLPDLTRGQIGALARVSIAAGMLLALLLFGLAPLLASFSAHLEWVLLIQGASLYFVILPWGLPNQAVLMRQLRFDVLAVVDVVAWAGSLALSWYLALHGWGPWSLLLAYLFKTAIQSFTMLAMGLAYFKFSGQAQGTESVRPLIRYGLYEAGSQTISALSYNLDKLMIAGFLGMEMLGIYYLAWQISIVPVSKINPLINRTLLPVYGQIKTQKTALNQWFQQSETVLMSFNAPLLIGLACCGSSVLSLLLGPAYLQASGVMALLCIAAIPVTIANASVNLFFVFGRSKVVFYWNLCLGAALLLGISAGLFYCPKLTTVGWVQLLISWLGLPVWMALLVRVSGVEWRPVAVKWLKIAGITLPMALYLVLIERFWPGISWWKAGIEFAGGVLIYVCLWYQFIWPAIKRNLP